MYTNITLPQVCKCEHIADSGVTESGDDKKQKVSYVADIVAANIIGVLSYLVQQAPAKTALLHSLRVK